MELEKILPSNTGKENLYICDRNFDVLVDQVDTNKTDILTLNTTVGSVAMTTTAQNVKGAINELDADIGNKTTLITTDKTNLVNAVNETKEQINDLDALTDGHIAKLVADSPHGIGSIAGQNYETGIFTPIYECSTGSFATLVYSNQSGRYTRIGRIVYFDLNIATSNVDLGTAGGNLLISGLPFIQSSIVLGAGAFSTSLKRFSLLSDDIVRFLVSTNKIAFYLDKPNGINLAQATPSILKTGALSYYNDVRLSGFYTL